MDVQDLVNTIVGQAVEIERQRTRIAILEAENRTLHAQAAQVNIESITEPGREEGAERASA